MFRPTPALLDLLAANPAPAAIPLPTVSASGAAAAARRVVSVHVPKPFSIHRYALVLAGRQDDKLARAAPHTILRELLTSRADAELLATSGGPGSVALTAEQRAALDVGSLIDCMKRATTAPLLTALEPVITSGKVGHVAIAAAGELTVSRMHLAFRRTAVNATHSIQMSNPFAPFASFHFQIMSLSALNPVVLDGKQLSRDTWHTLSEGSIVRFSPGSKRVRAYYDEVERRARRTATARIAAINAGGSGDDGTFEDPCAGLPPVVVPVGVNAHGITGAYVFTQAASAAELAQATGPVVACKPDISLAQVRSDLELYILQQAQARHLVLQAELADAAGASAAVGTKRKAGAAALDDDDGGEDASEAVEELKKQKTVTGAIADHCTCTTCASLMQDAVTLTCGHVMCEGCVVEWFRRSGKKKCPSCREPQRGDPKPAYLVRDVVASIEQLTLTAEERAERAAATAERTAERRSREDAAARRKEAAAAAKAARAAAARGPVINIGGAGAGAGVGAGVMLNAFDAAIRRGGPAVRAAAAAAGVDGARRDLAVAAGAAAAPAAAAAPLDAAAIDAAVVDDVRRMLGGRPPGQARPVLAAAAAAGAAGARRDLAAAAAAVAPPAAAARAPIGRLRAIDLDSDDDIALFGAPGEFQF